MLLFGAINQEAHDLVVGLGESAADTNRTLRFSFLAHRWRARTNALGHGHEVHGERNRDVAVSVNHGEPRSINASEDRTRHKLKKSGARNGI